MVVHENTGRTSETFVRLEQDGIDVKNDVNGKVSIRRSGEVIYGRFRRQGEIKCRVRWIILKRVETIKGAELRVGLISTTQIDNGGIEVRTMSGVGLL